MIREVNYSLFVGSNMFIHLVYEINAENRGKCQTSRFTSNLSQ